VTRVLRDDLGLWEYARRWALHNLTEAQKAERVLLSISLLKALRVREETEFNAVMTVHELCVCDRYQETSVWFVARGSPTDRGRCNWHFKSDSCGIFLGARLVVRQHHWPE
jgi:hypothetical protein